MPELNPSTPPTAPDRAPFFSILLPTKNRAEIVSGTIQSYLNQTFGDFEVIVSDNDDSDIPTRDAVARFTDPRVRYFRTSGKLPMHENYDFALRQARGAYVVALEDKLHLTPQALEVLHAVIQEHPEDVISYPFILSQRETLETSPRPVRLRKFTCEQTVEEFCRFTPTYWDIFPRGITSCAPRALYDEVRRRSPTGMVFSWINPDYSQAFQILSIAKGLLYLNQPIIFVPPSLHRSGKYSNGLAAIRKAEQAVRFFQSLPIDSEEMLRDVPVKSHWLWVNPVLYDFRKFYHRPGHHPQVDWVRYHVQCLSIMVIGLLWGGDVRNEWREVRQSLRTRGLIFSTRVAVIFFWRAVRSVVFRMISRLRY